MSLKRVGVFVDVTHQFAAVQERYNKKINYELYLKHAVNSEHLMWAYAYGTQISTEAEGFIKRLRSFGYEPKYLKALSNGEKKVDLTAMDFTLEIATDIIRHYERLDSVILGSNDSRFIPVVKFLQERGLRVVIFACQIPNDLASTANKAVELPEEILDKGRI